MWDDCDNDDNDDNNNWLMMMTTWSTCSSALLHDEPDIQNFVFGLKYNFFGHHS